MQAVRFQNNQTGGDVVAKMKAECLLMGVVEQTSSKDGKKYQHASLFFPEDGSFLNCGLDRNKPEMFPALKALGVSIPGYAEVAIRESKGIKFLDLVSFDKKK